MDRVVRRRTIAVVTTGRADYGIYRPLLERLAADPDVALRVVAGGMHLRPEYGDTVRDIAADGFRIAARVGLLDGDDGPLGVARAMGRGLAKFARAFERLAPDIVVVLGDRFEMHAAATAALATNRAIAHLHGGELTLGVLDDPFRHSMTKMAHLHFVATETYARRVRQMGEEPWRVVVSGAPGLDNLAALTLPERPELERMLGMALDPAPLLVTYHPLTREDIAIEDQAQALLDALDRAGRPVVFTAPNADAGGRRLRRLIEAFAAAHPARARFVEHLGTAAYFGLMRLSAAMVGNTSSGIIEAASLGTPVVDVGTRQEGRVRPANVVNVPVEAEAIARAVETAVSPRFRASLAGLSNPYAAARPAALTIHRTLVEVALGPGLLKKRFVDL